jgi:peptidoglycan hydrolase-like protein with peptidoglycan-binding domain
MRIRHSIWTLAVLLLLFGSPFSGYGSGLPSGRTRAVAAKPKAKASTAKYSKPRTPSKKTAARRRVRRARPTRVRAQMAPTPDRISEIQAALAREGTYQGETNGRWDSATEEAMKQFQSKHGLNPTGKLDALTLQKLGLGSAVAGLGAPLPLPEPQASVLEKEQTQHP